MYIAYPFFRKFKFVFLNVVKSAEIIKFLLPFSIVFVIKV